MAKTHKGLRGSTNSNSSDFDFEGEEDSQSARRNVGKLLLEAAGNAASIRRLSGQPIMSDFAGGAPEIRQGSKRGMHMPDADVECNKAQRGEDLLKSAITHGSPARPYGACEGTIDDKHEKQNSRFYTLLRKLGEEHERQLREFRACGHDSRLIQRSPRPSIIQNDFDDDKDLACPGPSSSRNSVGREPDCFSSSSFYRQTSKNGQHIRSQRNSLVSEETDHDMESSAPQQVSWRGPVGSVVEEIATESAAKGEDLLAQGEKEAEHQADVENCTDEARNHTDNSLSLDSASFQENSLSAKESQAPDSRRSSQGSPQVRLDNVETQSVQSGASRSMQDSPRLPGDLPRNCSFKEGRRSNRRAAQSYFRMRSGGIQANSPSGSPDDHRMRRGDSAATFLIEDMPLELHEFWQYYLTVEAEKSSQSNQVRSKSDERRKLFKNKEKSKTIDNLGGDGLHGKFSFLLGNLLRALVSNPASKRRLAWDVVGIVFLAMDLILIPLQVFDYGEFGHFRHVTFAFWTLDLISCFFVGYHHKGVVEMRLHKIAKHYLKTWFALDVTLVVLDVSVLLFGIASQSSTLRFGKLMRGVRALKLLRVVKFRAILGDFASQIRSEYIRTLLDIVKIILFIVAVNHYIACFFYGLHHLEHGYTWVDKNFDSSAGIDYRYFTALHWSLTQFTPASMEVSPVNSLERIFTVLVLLFALVTFSSFVSSITAAMTHLRQLNAKKLDENSKLLKYLAERCISPQLTSRVLHFFQERATRAGTTMLTKEDDVELFAVLPESIKHELRNESFMPALTKHPMFMFFREGDAIAVQNICGGSLLEKQLMVMDELYGHLMPVSHMLFVQAGALAYEFRNDFMQEKVIIETGGWACEVCLWTQRPIDSNPFVAKENCSLVMLWEADFMRHLEVYPNFGPEIAAYGQEFMERASIIAQECRYQAVLMNGHDEIQQIVDSTMRDEEPGNIEEEDGMGDQLNILGLLQRRASWGPEEGSQVCSRGSQQKKTCSSWKERMFGKPKTRTHADKASFDDVGRAS